MGRGINVQIQKKKVIDSLKKTLKEKQDYPKEYAKLEKAYQVALEK